jgi:hypothetical protein
VKPELERPPVSGETPVPTPPPPKGSTPVLPGEKGRRGTYHSGEKEGREYVPQGRRGTYSVQVSTVGEVYRGSEYPKAYRLYQEYAWQSCVGYGRGDGERVQLYSGDQLLMEYQPCRTGDHVTR